MPISFYMRPSKPLVLISTACVTMIAQPARASTATANGTIQANVQASCSVVSVSTIDFGTLSSVGALAANNDQTGTITVACSNGASYTVYIGDGNNRVSAGSGNRQMANGTARLPYQLYKETGRINIWDATGGTTATGGSGGVNGTGTGSNQALTVFARIPSGITLPTTTGGYTDQVLVTVTY